MILPRKAVKNTRMEKMSSKAKTMMMERKKDLFILFVFSVGLSMGYKID